ncbi:MAG: hypothetical protein ACLRMJ_04505 [Alistipes finegoldii]
MQRPCAEQVENLLAEYALRGDRGARPPQPSSCAFTARYRMIRVEYVCRGAARDGRAALGRSRRRRFRRLVLVTVRRILRRRFRCGGRWPLRLLLPVRGCFCCRSVGGWWPKGGGVGGAITRSRSEACRLLSREAVVCAGGFAPVAGIPRRREPLGAGSAPRLGEAVSRAAVRAARRGGGVVGRGAIAAAVWGGGRRPPYCSPQPSCGASPECAALASAIASARAAATAAAPLKIE